MIVPIIVGAAAIAAGAAGYEVWKKKQATASSGDTGSGSAGGGGALSDPTSDAANAAANTTQPQPAGQPPLPPAPSPESMPANSKAIVTTAQTGQAGALQVRTTPSTMAPFAPNGSAVAGGGYDHGSVITITGPMTSGFVPTSGMARNGQMAVGWAWAGYLTDQGATMTGEAVFSGMAKENRRKAALQKKYGNGLRR